MKDLLEFEAKHPRIMYSLRKSATDTDFEFNTTRNQWVFGESKFKDPIFNCQQNRCVSVMDVLRTTAFMRKHPCLTKIVFKVEAHNGKS